jgi:hypothetical protein
MQFGAFIAPRVDDIAGVRERVLAAEQAGLPCPGGSGSFRQRSRRGLHDIVDDISTAF